MQIDRSINKEKRMQQITQEPLIRRIDLTVPPASLEDTASDWERLVRAVRLLLPDRPIEATLAALREIGPALRQGGWQVKVTLADIGSAWRTVSVKPGFDTIPLLGLAIDLGTTTIVADLVDVETGQVLASKLAYNAQREFGTDVTSRMMYAEKTDGLATLRQEVVKTINKSIAELCVQARVESLLIQAAVIAGNTVMLHLLLGLDTSSIRREPYVSAATTYPVLDAAVAGIQINEGAPLYLFPAAGGYVGGDVTAGLLATRIAEEEPLSILLDIGTNGETVLGNREFLLACSGSAGSAFEGCGLEWGMAAQPGAIDRLRFEENRTVYHTVGDEPPRGICGSGLIEALGAFLQSGLINRSGRVNLALPGAHSRAGHPEIVLVPADETSVGRDIILRQGDIENLIRDKAALYAGSRILLVNAGLTFDDVARIFIAGNFGQSLEIDQAVRIGLLPDIPRERIQFIGNSSLAGARAALLSRVAWRRAQEIASSITCLELTVEPRYFDEYTAALFLPHTDLSLFPSLI
jgi:uncharacterized 2Fe-2S/4Fe-4S cluster protein (DUF4445 family)